MSFLDILSRAVDPTGITAGTLAAGTEAAGAVSRALLPGRTAAQRTAAGASQRLVQWLSGNAGTPVMTEYLKRAAAMQTKLGRQLTTAEALGIIDAIERVTAPAPAPAPRTSTLNFGAGLLPGVLGAVTGRPERPTRVGTTYYQGGLGAPARIAYGYSPTGAPDAEDAIVAGVGRTLDPRLRSINSMLSRAATQRQATHEHRQINRTSAYRRSVLRRLAQLAGRLPDGHPLRTRTIRVIMGR